jgi:VTC domain
VSALPNGDMHRHLPAILESPSLYRGESELPAFEVKFLLTEAEARAVEQRLRPRLAIDPHADPSAGGTYHVTSIYFDTPSFDVYRRTARYRRRKYRVRRYGDSASAFLERKFKSAQQVRKRRTAVPLVELSELAGQPRLDWAGAWFAQQLAIRGLRPVCRVSYERIALIGSCSNGPIRATFDRAACGQKANGHGPEFVSDGVPLLHGEVIAEFKFMESMPPAFKTVVEELRLTPRPVSKYRRCVEAVGLCSKKDEVDAS